MVSWQDVHDMVTAVGYSRDGKKAVVGTMRGKCRFYSVGGDRGGLEYEAQLGESHGRGPKSPSCTYMFRCGRGGHRFLHCQCPMERTSLDRLGFSDGISFA